jgi:hypothetical protein
MQKSNEQNSTRQGPLNNFRTKAALAGASALTAAAAVTGCSSPTPAPTPVDAVKADCNAMQKELSGALTKLTQTEGGNVAYFDGPGFLEFRDARVAEANATGDALSAIGGCQDTTRSLGANPPNLASAVQEGGSAISYTQFASAQADALARDPAAFGNTLRPGDLPAIKAASDLLGNANQSAGQLKVDLGRVEPSNTQESAVRVTSVAATKPAANAKRRALRA